MNLGFIAAVLRKRRAPRGQERWSRTELDGHRHQALEELRRFAVQRSLFYRRLHAGLEERPLGDLPIVTKAEPMASFDEVSTDPDVRLEGVGSFLEGLAGSTGAPVADTRVEAVLVSELAKTRLGKAPLIRALR